MDRYKPFENRQFKLDPLTVFCFLWALQGLIHQETFQDWLKHREILGTVLTINIILVLIRPWLIVPFGTMVFLNIVDSLIHLPYRVNHILFEDLVNLTLLSALLWTAFRFWRTADRTVPHWQRDFLNTRESRGQFFETFAPVVRIELVLLYVFVTLHKLNIDYFNPAVSCGSVMLEEIIQTFPYLGFLRALPGLTTISLWVSILSEGGLALLLFLPQTRRIALVLGLFFHFMLGVHPHQGVYSFSTSMYALFFLFTPPAFTDRLSEDINIALKLWRENKRVRGYVLGAALLYGLIGVAVIAFTKKLNPYFDKSLAVWAMGAVVLIVVYLMVLLRTPSSVPADPRPLFPNRGLLWIFPVIVILHGINPYLGLKTKSAFAMFSNLRTEEGKSNHFFIPANLQVFNFQKGLVQVTASDHPKFKEYVEQDLLLTRFEFERALHEVKEDFTVDYVVNGIPGQVRKSKGVITGIDPNTVYTEWLGRFLLFRPIDRGALSRCQH